MINEDDVFGDLAELLAKYGLKGAILLVPEDNEGTRCFRIGADDALCIRVMEAVAEDLRTGHVSPRYIQDN